MLIVVVRLAIAMFTIIGYALVGAFEVIWYQTHARSERIGEAVGRMGQASIDAVAEVFRWKREGR